MDEAVAGRRLAKHVVVVMSGKGGVGKSSVSVQLALSLSRRRLRVGLLDVDLCGPSVARMLGVEGAEVRQSERGWVPVRCCPLGGDEPPLLVMSMAFLSPDRNAAVVWRGPRKTSVIAQFLHGVDWGSSLDYLIVDTPPGTSDEHITVTTELKRFLPPLSVVLVTTPQNVSLGDVRREIAFCRTADLPILGLFENMSGFVCPHCSTCTPIFASGGGAAVAASQNIPFLGCVPIDPRIGELLDGGNDLHQLFLPGPNGTCSLQAVMDFADGLIRSDGEKK